MNTKTICWGIIGPGRIARQFAADLQLSGHSRLHAVASRSLQRAESFGMKYDAEKWYGSYEALARDEAVDAVYIATPHSCHFEHTMLCLQHGKSVLCEKPMGLCAAEVETMIREAAAQRVFLMEAMWTRFLPATGKLLELLEKKIIGDLSFIHADFGFAADPDPAGRLYNKQLGGGCLMDIGIYPVYLALLTLGLPSAVQATARMAGTNVDRYCAMLFDFPGGARAILESTFEAETPTEAVFYGTQGRLTLHSRFHQSNKITIERGKEISNRDLPYRGNGYIHEIEEVEQCLLSGRLESAKMPLAMSLELIRTLDRVKAEIGLQYDSPAL
jgi:predicted dehydrogenase